MATVTTSTRALRVQPPSRTLLNRINWAGIITILLIVAIWQLLVSSGLVSEKALPSPIEVWDDLLTQAGGAKVALASDFWGAVLYTISAVLIAWAAAVVIGVAIGFAIGLNRTLYAWSMATIDVLRSVPLLVFFPIAILLWGTSLQSEVFVAAYGATWPVLVATAKSVGNVEPRLFDVARTFKFSPMRTFFKFIVPATGASTIAAARLALGIALIGAVTMEVIGTPRGIGYQVIFYQSVNNVGPMWVYILITGVIGILLNALFVALVRVLFPGVALWSVRGRD